jgi:tetratricopeptide (TPR) repeat protein
MGSVFKARHVATGRTVALKVLGVELSRQKHLIQRFLRESRAATKVVHPNVVTAYDAGETGETFYYVMEFVHGVSVEEMIRRQKQLEEKIALDITRQIALGLEGIHGAGYVHRDVKPQNILVDANGVAKLCDLGLARFETDQNSSLTATGTILGTPYYISPEQVEGRKDIDTRSDLYSLGCTLFAMLGGRPPYVADSMMAIIAKHMKDPIPDVRTLNRSVSERTVHLLNRMLRKNRSERFQTPGELVRAIDALLEGRPAATTRLSRPTTMRFMSQRRRVSTAPTGAIVVAVLVVAGGILFLAAMGSRTSTPVRRPPPPARTPEPEVARTEDPAARDLYASLQTAARDRQWDKLKLGAAQLLTGYFDAPVVVTNRSTIEGWISEAEAALRAEAEAMAGQSKAARALLDAGKWAEAESALDSVLKKFGNRLLDEATLRADLESARRELSAVKLVSEIHSLKQGEDLGALEIALNRLKSEFGSTRTYRDTESGWTALSNSLRLEKEAAIRFEEAGKAAAAKDLDKLDECLDHLRGACAETRFVARRAKEIGELRALADREREGRMEELAAKAFERAGKEVVSNPQSALAQYETAIERYSSTEFYRRQTDNINDIVKRCRELLATRRHEAAVILWANAEFEFRHGNWSSALALYQKVLDEYPDTACVRSHRSKIEASRDKCARKLK